MRIVIIGGTGFIGSHVVARLAAEHEVTVVHRGKHSVALPPTVHCVIGDRDRLAEIAAEFRRQPPDVVLDMIAGDERQAHAVVDAFRGVAGRLVTTGSIDVYRACEIALGLAPGPLEPVRSPKSRHCGPRFIRAGIGLPGPSRSTGSLRTTRKSSWSA